MSPIGGSRPEWKSGPIAGAAFDKMMARLRQLVEAVTTPLSLTPDEARKRMHHLNNTDANDAWEWSKRKREGDPIVNLEDARLRSIIIVEEIETEIQKLWGDLFPTQRDADMATIRTHLGLETPAQHSLEGEIDAT